MRILFVTSEIAGLYKLGGLGDVSFSLPVALSRLGVQVSLVMPYYEKITLAPVKCIGQLAADFDRRREIVFVFRTTLPRTRIPVYLFRHPLFNKYHAAASVDNFAFFSKCVAEFYLYSGEKLGGPYDIVHCQDWHTALIPLLIGEECKVGKQIRETLESTRVRTVFTIHNHLYQGETGVMTVLRLGLPLSLFHVYETPRGRAIKLMREALEYADILTTVSPTYARELITAEHGDEINLVMKRRQEVVAGILNGIDQNSWNPRSDRAISANYDLAGVRAGKAKNKKSLRQALKLPASAGPLFGFIGRLESQQKGVDLITKSLEPLVSSNFQLVILGRGSPGIVKKLQDSIKPYPHVVFVNTFDERLARRIYAAADVILVPSKFEPCGLIQLIAMRYGALPLVRKTGGLADTVVNRRTGFVFKRYRAGELVEKMREAITLYHENPRLWQQMVGAAMRQDFSWDRSAQAYLDLYRKLVGAKKTEIG